MAREKNNMSISIPNELIENIKTIAKVKNMSYSELVEELITSPTTVENEMLLKEQKLNNMSMLELKEEMSRRQAKDKELNKELIERGVRKEIVTRVEK